MKIGFAYASGDSPHDGLGPFRVLGEAVDLRYSDVDSVDAVVLWGGTDINPAIYKAKPHPLNGYNPSSMRDEREVFYVKRAIDRGIPLIGVCRGAQLLCAMAGGKLVQHMNGHHSDHPVIIAGTSTVYQSSSSHHQMMWPFEAEHVMLADSMPRSSRYEGESREDVMTPPSDPEVVLFPKIKALAIQGHPEWQDDDEPFVVWCVAQAKKLLEN